MIFLIMMVLNTGCGIILNSSPKKGGSLDKPLGIEYFECVKCGSLDGGYYGKGSVSSWINNGGTFCYHNWISISKEKFDKKWKERVGDTNHY